MNTAITVGMVAKFLLIALVALGVVGVLVLVLSIYAKGFNH